MKVVSVEALAKKLETSGIIANSEQWVTSWGVPVKEIVQCKDCRWWQWAGFDNDIMKCRYWKHSIRPEDYCSMAVKK